jgi:hypothetical protein
MYKEKIVNIETGEETLRDYTTAEIAQVEAAQVETAKRIVDENAKEAARKTILNKLGLTDDEAKLLLG